MPCFPRGYTFLMSASGKVLQPLAPPERDEDTRKWKMLIEPGARRGSIIISGGYPTRVEMSEVGREIRGSALAFLDILHAIQTSLRPGEGLSRTLSDKPDRLIPLLLLLVNEPRR